MSIFSTPKPRPTQPMIIHDVTDTVPTPPNPWITDPTHVQSATANPHFQRQNINIIQFTESRRLYSPVYQHPCSLLWIVAWNPTLGPIDADCGLDLAGPGWGCIPVGRRRVRLSSSRITTRPLNTRQCGTAAHLHRQT